MKNLLERVIQQLDTLDSRLDSVDRTLVKQEENLKEHMRRTELLEKQHDKLLHEELLPIKSHVEQVKGITKFVLIATPVIFTALGALYKYLT
jgi:hypothetical protein